MAPHVFQEGSGPLQQHVADHGTQSSLVHLPTEILEAIAEHCSITDLVSIMQCNRRLHHGLCEFMIHLAVKRNSAKAIMWAVYHGNLDLLAALHRHNAPIRSQWGVQGRGALSRHDSPILSSSCIADPECELERTFSALHIAALRGHDNVISWLIDKGVGIDGISRMVCQCYSCNDGIMPFSRGFYAHRHDKFCCSWTPLHVALCQGHVASAKLLMQRGAAVNDLSSTHSGLTALHTAVRSESLEMTRLVLEHGGCDIDAANQHGSTALGMAIYPLSQDPDFRARSIGLLLEAGASPTIECTFPIKPWRDLNLANIDAYLPDVKLLPLHLAILAGNAEAMVALLDAGADVNRISGGHSPLHCAFGKDSLLKVNTNAHRNLDRDFAYQGPQGPLQQKTLTAKPLRPLNLRVEMVKKLLAAGADVNGKTVELPDGPTPGFVTGATPLMYAAGMERNEDVIELLLEHGADVRSLDSMQQNALHWLISPLTDEDHPPEQRFPQFSKEFVDDGSARRIIELLLEYGCDATQRNARGQCILEVAASGIEENIRREGDDAMLRILTDIGVRPDCVNDGCLDEALERSLMSLRYDYSSRGPTSTALVLVKAGAVVTEPMLVGACNKYLATQRTDNLHDDLFFHRIIKLAEKNGVLGESLKSVLLSSDRASAAWLVRELKAKNLQARGLKARKLK